MPRVLFVDHVDRTLGGAEINLLELVAEAQRNSQWEMAVACRANGPLGKRIKELGVRQFEHGFGEGLNTLRFAGRGFPFAGVVKGWSAMVKASRELATIIGRFAPDVLISCTIKDHMCSARANRTRSVPSVWWVNDLLTPDFFPPLALMAVRRDASAPQSIIAVSSSVAAPFSEWHQQKKLRVIHNGIPLERYRRLERGYLRTKLAIPMDAPMFGIVGRICPWKGQQLFLEAAEMWAQAQRPGHFVIVGQAFNEDQTYEADLRHFVRESSLGGRVHFAGFEENMAAVLSDLDVLLHTSIRPEPFGRVLVESMAVDTPVIAANAGGAREIVEHGVNGLLARSGDAADYFEKLQQLWPRGELSERLIATARNTVEHRFTIQRVRREFEEVIAGNTIK